MWTSRARVPAGSGPTLQVRRGPPWRHQSVAGSVSGPEPRCLHPQSQRRHRPSRSRSFRRRCPATRRTGWGTHRPLHAGCPRRSDGSGSQSPPTPSRQRAALPSLRRRPRWPRRHGAPDPWRARSTGWVDCRARGCSAAAARRGRGRRRSGQQQHQASRVLRRCGFARCRRVPRWIARSPRGRFPVGEGLRGTWPNP
ncbi:unannotated protein [freshwater metagenome]|uniref:Unannotated protein n=1 Tax=freshwater metagenome TaxID=449393 RepID=A0A6J7UP15_9ZZZZ